MRRPKPKLKQPESVADFKARLAEKMPRPTLEERREGNASIRAKGQSGFYPAPEMNEDPTQPIDPRRCKKCGEDFFTSDHYENGCPAEVSDASGSGQNLGLAVPGSSATENLAKPRIRWGHTQEEFTKSVEDFKAKVDPHVKATWKQRCDLSDVDPDFKDLWDDYNALLDLLKEVSEFASFAEPEHPYEKTLARKIRKALKGGAR